MGQIVNGLDELKSIVEREKRQGKRIVFGNGCFDLLHVGHVRYLKGAKALGDILIAAVNDDSSMTGWVSENVQLHPHLNGPKLSRPSKALTM